jgi:hypothetical protein
MARRDFCSCSEKGTYGLGIATLATGELVCNNCNGLIPPTDLGDEVFEPSSVEVPQEIKSYKKPSISRGEGNNLQSHIQNGNAAALRTKSYATLFENIGKVIQALNLIAVIILSLAVLFIPTTSLMKFVYWVVILIAWGISYVQTALIRGVASYFQMKASDHLIRHLK